MLKSGFAANHSASNLVLSSWHIHNLGIFLALKSQVGKLMVYLFIVLHRNRRIEATSFERIQQQAQSRKLALWIWALAHLENKNNF